MWSWTRILYRLAVVVCLWKIRFCHETESESKNLERPSQHVEDVEKLPFVTGESSASVQMLHYHQD